MWCWASWSLGQWWGPRRRTGGGQRPRRARWRAAWSYTESWSQGLDTLLFKNHNFSVSSHSWEHFWSLCCCLMQFSSLRWQLSWCSSSPLHHLMTGAWCHHHNCGVRCSIFVLASDRHSWPLAPLSTWRLSWLSWSYNYIHVTTITGYERVTRSFPNKIIHRQFPVKFPLSSFLLQRP